MIIYRKTDRIMKRFWILAATAVLSMGAVAAKDRPISFEQLPHQAKELITKEFGRAKVLLATEDREAHANEYEVTLDDRTKIDFDHNGLWRDIECPGKSVPSNIVPKKIATHVASHYPQARIVGIERERNGFEVQLSTGLELKFDASLRCVGVDD